MPDCSAQENLDLFFEHLAIVEPRMAGVLRDNIDKLIPLPQVPAQKTGARMSFHEAVIAALEKPEKAEAD